MYYTGDFKFVHLICYFYNTVGITCSSYLGLEAKGNEMRIIHGKNLADKVMQVEQAGG